MNWIIVVFFCFTSAALGFMFASLIVASKNTLYWRLDRNVKQVILHPHSRKAMDAMIYSWVEINTEEAEYLTIESQKQSKEK